MGKCPRPLTEQYTGTTEAEGKWGHSHGTGQAVPGCEGRRVRLELADELQVTFSSPATKPGATLDTHWHGGGSFWLHLSLQSLRHHPTHQVGLLAQVLEHLPRSLGRGCPLLSGLDKLIAPKRTQKEPISVRALLNPWQRAVPPLAKIWSIPGQPGVWAAAYDSRAKCKACRLDGDLWGGVHWLGGGGSSGGSGGLR